MRLIAFIWPPESRLESSCIPPVNTVLHGCQAESLWGRNYDRRDLELREVPSVGALVDPRESWFTDTSHKIDIVLTVRFQTKFPRPPPFTPVYTRWRKRFEFANGKGHKITNKICQAYWRERSKHRSQTEVFICLFFMLRWVCVDCVVKSAFADYSLFC